MFLNWLLPIVCVGCGAWGVTLCSTCMHTLTYSPVVQPCDPIDQLVSFLPYQGLVKRCMHAIKFDAMCDVADALARHDAFEMVSTYTDTTYTYCFPVPIDHKRYHSRGFNQVDKLWRPAIEHAQCVETWSSALYRSTTTPHLYDLSKVSRAHMLEGVFSLDPLCDVQGQACLIVDDIVTTGATLKEIARCLKEKGAARVDAWTLAYTPLNG